MKDLEERLNNLVISTKLKDDEQQKDIDFLLKQINLKVDEDTFNESFERLHDMIAGLGKG